MHASIDDLMMPVDDTGREIYGMTTMTEDQGTLLHHESTVKDDYTLSYR